ncbi:hypothetical protein MASR2M74_18130 [Paracoccaceae bacterium]
MTAWQNISVEEAETERTLCDCCRGTTVTAFGDLRHHDKWLGWYTVRFGADANRHPSVINLYVGDWSEKAPDSARWGMRVEWRDDGFELLDWSSEEKAAISSYVPLGRDDVLGFAFEAEFWAMIDASIMKDSRLQELRRDP